jgi:hypothetical protein
LNDAALMLWIWPNLVAVGSVTAAFRDNSVTAGP